MGREINTVLERHLVVKGAVHLACGYYRPGRFATPFDRFGSNLDQSDLRANYEWLWSQILKMLGRLATNLALIWPIWPNIAKSVVLKVETWNSHWTDIFQSYEWIWSQIWKKLSCLATNLAQIWPIWDNIAKYVVLKLETWNSHWTDIFQSYEWMWGQIREKLLCLAKNLA